MGKGCLLNVLVQLSARSKVGVGQVLGPISVSRLHRAASRITNYGDYGPMAVMPPGGTPCLVLIIQGTIHDSKWLQHPVRWVLEPMWGAVIPLIGSTYLQ